MTDAALSCGSLSAKQAKAGAVSRLGFAAFKIERIEASVSGGLPIGQESVTSYYRWRK
jgi:hypothetical protein